VHKQTERTQLLLCSFKIPTDTIWKAVPVGVIPTIFYKMFFFVYFFWESIIYQRELFRLFPDYLGSPEKGSYQSVRFLLLSRICEPVRAGQLRSRLCVRRLGER